MFCALLMQAKISGERLQDHWSSGFIHPFVCLFFFFSEKDR